MKKDQGATTGDHLPPVPQGAGGRATLFVLGDRLLFALAGLVLGFAAAYLYLDRVPQPHVHDPHEGVETVQTGPGASRDLPGSGGGAPRIPVDPALRQRLADLEAAVAREPQSYELLVQLGNTAYDLNDWRRAVDAYESALKLKGGDPNVLTDLGISYRGVGDSGKALERFREAQKRDPGHWQSRFNEALVLGVDQGEKAKALAILERLVKEHPEVPAIAALAETLKKG